MEQLFNFQTFSFTFSFKPFSFPTSYESRQVNFYFASDKFFQKHFQVWFSEKISSSFGARKEFMQRAQISAEKIRQIWIQRILQAISALAKLSIVKNEKRHFKMLIMKSLKLNFENCSAFIEMIFNHAKPPTLQNDIYFLSNFFKEQSFGKHANAELFQFKHFLVLTYRAQPEVWDLVNAMF